ncbi:MAG: DUF5665 domain-containing protein [Candidatus Gracilibacteria bacterium]|nr:DUF5665 domain-containing protein [Candidatus Gracilibacteria bacterium]
MSQKKKVSSKKAPKNPLHLEVTKLTKQFRRANAMWLVFLRGIVSGAGAAIGATVFAGIILLILFRLIQAVDTIPYVKDLIEATQIDRLVEKQLESQSD